MSQLSPTIEPCKVEYISTADVSEEGLSCLALTHARKCYISVVTCALGICPICMPSG